MSDERERSGRRGSELRGAVATGAASGVGAAVGRRLAAPGARLPGWLSRIAPGLSERLVVRRAERG